MGWKRAYSKRPRRASRRLCPWCGDKQVLGPCGVAEHLYAQPGRPRQIGDCNGRVYIHEANGCADACPSQANIEHNR